MRITQPTQALNPFLLALLLQLIASPACAAATPILSPARHTQQKRLSSLDELDCNAGNQKRGSCHDTESEPCGDLNSCKSSRPNGVLGRGGSAKQTATNIAQKAAHEAEQAYGTQQSAAAEVAQLVKKQLADRAHTAAKAAEAALAGKQQIVDQLEAELVEAEQAKQQAEESIAGSQSNLNAACLSARQAEHIFVALQNVLKLAQENVGHANTAASGAQHELDEKMQLAQSTQSHVELLQKSLCESRRELLNIKKSAYKAICAAAEARRKANRERRLASANGPNGKRRRHQQQGSQQQQQQQQQMQQQQQRQQL